MVAGVVFSSEVAPIKVEIAHAKDGGVFGADLVAGGDVVRLATVENFAEIIETLRLARGAFTAMRANQRGKEEKS